MINYFDMLGGGNSANRALGVAGGLQNLQANRQAMDIQRQQAAMQQQQGEQRNQQDLLTQSRLRLAEGAGAFLSSVQSGNAQGALQIANQYAEDIKRLDPSFTPEMVPKMMTTEEGRQSLIQQAQMLTQIAAGPEQSARFVAEQARPESEMSQPSSIREQQYYEDLKKTDPAAAEAFGRRVGFIESGREQAKTESERNLERYQQLKRTDPELAKQFGQQVGFVSREGRELSAQTQKRLSTFTDAAVESGRLEQRYLTLADDFEKSGIQGGVLGLGGTWRESIKEFTGEQDAISSLRRDYARIRGGEVVNNLPPGAASDADVALALAGFPSEKANAQQIASFLRGVAKLKGFEKRFNEFKANYISETGTERGMLQAWKEQSESASQQTNVVDWSSL